MEQDNLYPICCFIGSVDVGKTSLMDYLRHSTIAKNEVGGITQQIGLTYFTREKLDEMMEGMNKSLEINGLLMVDTAGHDCFSQMKLIGIKVSNLPILIVDIVKGIEVQTKFCIELLLKYDINFIIALNKIDRIYGWKPIKADKSKNLKNVLENQDKNVSTLMRTYTDKIICQLAELGLNGALYYENNSQSDTINMVPVSAITGEGIPDLMMIISKLTTKNFKKQLDNPNSLYSRTHGYVLEMRFDLTYGYVYHILLVSGTLKIKNTLSIETELNEDGDRDRDVDKTFQTSAIIKNIFVPPDVKELKNKTELKSVDEISGTRFVVVKFNTDNLNILMGGIFMDISTEIDINKSIIQKSIDKYLDSKEEIELDDVGVTINVLSKGMASGLIKLIKDMTKVKATVRISNIHIGKIQKTTIIKAGSILTQIKNKSDIEYMYNKRFSVIINYDINDTLILDDDVKTLASKMDVSIISGNLIHKLIETYLTYVENLNTKIMIKYPLIISSSVVMKILSKFIFLRSSPLLFGVQIQENVLKKDMIIKAVKSNQEIVLGKVISIQRKNKDVDQATKGDEVCIKIESMFNIDYVYGKDFDDEWILYNWMNEEDKAILYKYPDVFQ